MPSDRQERIERAREIIRENPDWGKNKVNAMLKSEYGHGLRSSEVLRIKSSEGLTPVVLKPIAPIDNRHAPSSLNTREGNRYEYLMNRGFARFEAKELSQMSYETLRETVTYRTLIAQRLALIDRCRKQGMSNKQIKAEIIADYRRNGGFKPTSSIVWRGAMPDIWQYVRNLNDKVKDRKTGRTPKEKSIRDFNSTIDTKAFDKALKRHNQ